MNDAAIPIIEVLVPDLVPDTRLRARVATYGHPTCLSGLVATASELYGLVSGLDYRGVEWLRSVAERSQQLRGILVLALYAGCPTWDDVLKDALEIQETSNGRLCFRVMARRVGPDRPANLLWLRADKDDPGTAILGNVTNLLVGVTWDATDAILTVPLATTGAEALRRWMDWLEQHSSPLTTRTAAAPRLVLPKGTEEGQRQWEDYLSVLDAGEADIADTPFVEVDPQTGEVSAKDRNGTPRPTLTSSGTLRRSDPLLEAVQKVLILGRLVSIDRVGRPPPFDAPLPPEMFGQRRDDRTGAIRRRQQFTISLFDEATRRTLENRRSEAGGILSRFSLMLQENQRWMPSAAFPLFEEEIEEAAKRGMEFLNGATNSSKPEEFVEAQREKIEADCQMMLRQVGRQTPPDKALLNKVLDDLRRRLSAHMESRMRPKFGLGNYQLVDGHKEELQPWGTIQTFLLGSVRMTREALVDPFHFRGLGVDRKAFVQAFDLFHEPLVRRFLDGKPYEDEARQQLDIAKQIEEDSSANCWAKSNALWKLIQGENKDHVRETLCAKQPTI